MLSVKGTRVQCAVLNRQLPSAQIQSVSVFEIFKVPCLTCMIPLTMSLAVMLVTFIRSSGSVTQIRSGGEE